MKMFLKTLMGTAAIFAFANAAQSQSLFVDMAQDMPEINESLQVEHQLRSRQVGINADALSRVFSKTNSASTVQLDLFPGRSVTLTQTGFDPFMGQGTRNWSGRIEGFEDGFATLVKDGDNLIGQVQYDGEIYQIMPTDSGMHVISELDVASFPVPEEDDYIDVTAETTGKTKNSSSIFKMAFPQRIRVLTMFTPAAATEAGSVSNLRNEAILALANSNTALANSAMNNRYKWAGFSGLYCGYPAQASTSTVLLDATNIGSNACVGNRAATRRDAVNADMVTVIKGTGGCGVAFFSSNGVSSNRAFSVSARPCLTQYTMTHELGHNQGLNHDRFAAGHLGINQTAYNYGLTHPTASPPFRTIMAYENGCLAAGVRCARVPVFSNTHPLGKWTGVTTGRGLHLTDPAIARKKLRETWNTIAAFR